MVKNDPDFVISPGLPNADALATTSARPAEARKLHRLPKICNERDSQYTVVYALYNTKLVLYANYANKTTFNAVLYEFEHGPLNFNLDRLESLIFNPIEYLPSTLENSFITNLDPDLNFNELMPSNSRYMIESEVNELVTDKPCNSGMSF